LAPIVFGVYVKAGVEQILHRFSPAILSREVKESLSTAVFFIERRAVLNQQVNERRFGTIRNY
jgi:hypothetical protein